MQRQKRKTEIITVRVTPRTKQVIQERAREAHMTITNYLCICALGQEIIRVDGLDTVLSELKAQGRNLNQLTTLANMGLSSVAVPSNTESAARKSERRTSSGSTGSVVSFTGSVNSQMCVSF